MKYNSNQSSQKLFPSRSVNTQVNFQLASKFQLTLSQTNPEKTPDYWNVTSFAFPHNPRKLDSHRCYLKNVKKKKMV